MKTPILLSLLLVSTTLTGSCAPAAAGSSPEAAEVAAAAGEAFAAARVAYEAGVGELDAVYLWSRRWQEARSEVAEAAAAEEHLARMVALEALVEGRYQQGLVRDMDRKAARFYRLQAEHRGSLR